MSGPQQTKAELPSEEKRVFLVAVADEARRKQCIAWIEQHIAGAKVFGANDGQEALFKMESAPPKVLIVDLHLDKVTGLDVVEQWLSHRHATDSSIIILSALPDREHFVEEVVRGKVQFLIEFNNEAAFTSCLTKALNRLSLSKDHEYSLRFVASGEILFKEGDVAHSVFIVRQGSLEAFKGSQEAPVHLGRISAGEFVGEMAYLNHEPHSATVKALKDCELIEIPQGSLDLVLFSKPAWSKALMRTLSKRLKLSNETVVKSQKKDQVDE